MLTYNILVSGVDNDLMRRLARIIKSSQLSALAAQEVVMSEFHLVQLPWPR